MSWEQVLAKRYADFIAARGRRVTEHQARVVGAILVRSGTFDHYDVLAECGSWASRATIYRTLANMIEADVVRRVRFNHRDVLVLAADDEGAEQ